jgi:hypothetical protein
MRTLILLGVLAAGFPALAADRGSEPEQESGFTASLRAGYGIPLGKFATPNAGISGNLSDEFIGQIPVWLDLGYRFKRNFIVSAYLQLGYPFLNENGPGLASAECHIPAAASCNGNISMHVGLEFIYVFARDVDWQPWAGIGSGYERTIYTIRDGQGGEANIAYSGWEFLNLQGGASYKVTSQFGFGPYVAFGLGQYGSVDISSGTHSHSIGIPQKELHEWLQFGVQGAFDF